MTTRDVLEDQLAHVDRDLAEIETQIAEGELDQATAARLRTVYVAERAALVDRIAAANVAAGNPPTGIDTARPAGPEAGHPELGQPGDGQPEAGQPAGIPAGERGISELARRSRTRAIIGSALVAIGFLAVTVVLLNVVTRRAPGELATGGVVSDVAANGGVDLADISNEEMEAVIAENPEVPAMRLALARRYFEAGDFSSAIPHFLVVLEQDGANAEALSSVGWITYLDGRSDIAVEYLDRSIELVPGYEPAYWFRANVLVGLDDAEGAAADLETLLAFDTVPDDIAAAATELLDSLGAG